MKYEIADATMDLEDRVSDLVSRVEALEAALAKKIARRFTPPTVAEVDEYVRGRRSNVDSRQFVDFYTAKGWRVGNTPMKDWRAAVRTWERSRNYNGSQYDDDQRLFDADSATPSGHKTAKDLLYERLRK